MIILGHKLISYKPLNFVKNKKELKNKQSVLFYYDEKMIKYCQDKKIEFSLMVKDKKEAVLANALQAKFIVCSENLAKSVQDLAEYYLFDSKVTIVTDDIQKGIELGVDGVILTDAIIN